MRKIGKENIVQNCVFNIEWVTDAAEKELARTRLTSRGGSVEGVGHGGRRVRSLGPLFFVSIPLLFSWMKVLKVMKNMNVVDTENPVSVESLKTKRRVFHRFSSLKM